MEAGGRRVAEQGKLEGEGQGNGQEEEYEGKEETLRGWKRGRRGNDPLKMNFSVGVSMYRLNVTSYWYLFRCNQRNVDANIDIMIVYVRAREGRIALGIDGLSSRWLK